MRITTTALLLFPLFTTLLATAAPVMSSPEAKDGRVEAQPVSPVQGNNGMSAARKAMSKSLGKAHFVQGKIEEQRKEREKEKGELKPGEEEGEAEAEGDEA